MGQWIDKEWRVPERLDEDQFALRMLSVDDLVKDYDAVMSSRHEIQGVFGPTSDWPGEDLTMRQDLIDLGWHEKEFQRRTSFAYTVMSPPNALGEEFECLGCVYIYPSEQVAVDAVVIVWARSGSGLDQALFESVKQWMAKDWPFSNVVFPGRDISWQDLALGLKS